MNYKILIKLFIPEIEEIYELYIPINKSVGEISIELCKMLHDITKIYPVEKIARLCNRQTGIIYEQNSIIRDTDIKNGSEIVIF